MRLVIDLQAAQGESATRGIGRQSIAFAKALAERRGPHQVMILLSGLFPESLEDLKKLFREILPPEDIIHLQLEGPVGWNQRGSRLRRYQAERKREKQLAALEPDIVHLCSLFEGLHDDSVTSVPLTGGRVLQSVTLHDLMPLVHPDHFLRDPAEKNWYQGKLEHLLRADLLLAVSDFARREGMRMLGLPEYRTVNISSAAADGFGAQSYSSAEINYLKEHTGLFKPFIMFTGGDSPQKNIEALIRAFAALPGMVRKKYQLAIVCSVRSEEKIRLRRLGASLGLVDYDVIFTGYVPDSLLIACYNLCHVFVFPSWHEGFGLPVLEAMKCGAPVIASNVASLPEVVGWDEALFDPHKPEEISALLLRILEEDGFRKALVEHGSKQSRKFSWEQSADRAWEAFENVRGQKNGAGERRTFFQNTKPCHPPKFPGVKDSTGTKSLIPPPLRADTVYFPEPPHSLVEYLGSGWSVPEKGGVWSDDFRSCLTLIPDPKLRGPQELVLKCQGYVSWSNPILGMHCLVDRKEQYSCWFHLLKRTRMIVLPLTCGNGKKAFRIEFHFNQPRQASKWRGGHDKRFLGMRLFSLQIRPGRDCGPGLMAKLLVWGLGLKGRAGRRFSSLAWSRSLREELRGRARRSRDGEEGASAREKSGTVSVVINTLNRAGLLKETLESLQRQTCLSFEVIVVNGPSTDGTEEVLQEWRGRIKTGHCPEANLSMSRNIGVALASGEFVAFLDDDAVAESEWLDQILEAFDSEEVAAVGGKVLDATGLDYQYEYARSDRLGRSEWKLRKACPERNFPGSYWFPYLQGTNAVFRRKALLEIKGFDEAFAYYLDETEACLRLNDAGYIIRQLDGARVLHKNASSTLRTNNIIQDHTPILVSKIYFCHRHGSRFHSGQEIEKECLRFINDHRNGIALLVREGVMTKDEAMLFEERAENAWNKAMMLAGDEPRLMDLRCVNDQEGVFLPFFKD